jgi:hypothetical protein
MWNPALKQYIAETAIAVYRIVKFGSTDDYMVQAAGATDGLIGISGGIAAIIAERVDVIKSGIADVEYGGVVTRGDPITSDANGKAVKAVAGQNIIGFAEASGVSGDIGSCLISPHVLAAAQGADGLTVKGVLRVDYDFAVHGGGVGAIPLGVILPNKAVIAKAFGDIISALSSTAGTGTIALGCNTANDLLLAVDADTLSGRFDLIPVGTVATMVKATAAREITLTVGTNAILGGKAVFFLEYVISD